MSECLHGDYNQHGNRRWCKGHGKWVDVLDWDDHFGCYGYDKKELEQAVQDNERT